MVAVISRTSEAANSFASKFDIQKTYCSYEEFAKDPEIGLYDNDKYLKLSILIYNSRMADREFEKSTNRVKPKTMITFVCATTLLSTQH